MTTETQMATRQPDAELPKCRSDISITQPSGPARYTQSPLLSIVRDGTCKARGCTRSSQHHDGGRLGYCQAHRERLRTRGRLDEHIPLRKAARATPDVPLSDDVDEVAVDRVMTGQRTPLTPAEMRYVVALMSNRDLSAAHIADVIGVCERTVVRCRARIRAEAS